MNITESLKIAVKCIKANWMRSVLTMLGIIIGITSVIMIVGAGTGVRDYIIGLIEDMGSNAVLVSVDTTQATDNDYITLDDVDNIKTKVSGVERCSPMLMGFGNATIDATATEATVMMVGVNSDVQFAMTNTCEYGRFFTDEEYAANAPIAVMGLESAKTAFGYEDATGQSITVSSSGKSMKIKVCGVANIDAMVNSLGGGTSIGSMFQTNSDKPMIALFMPCTTLTQITGASANLSNVFVIAEEGKDYDTVGNATVNYLKAVHGNYSNGMYTAQNMATYIEIVDIIMKVLTIFIAGVGAISLIVGGIGVMNIMLVSVTERTREIGIRKSLGAKTRVITMQFLTESIILCLIGGFIGVVLGIAGAFAACSIIDITPKISIWLILLALLFSSGVGLFFGIYPAKKAAQLSPIDALRSE
ncbi:ABC transporter permease [Eubacterium coprostanoligenes]|uniref:ABC transporter permease n=1 Tax=Eubacterium coprostanoligenes TaxID=290054 RepID=UPI0023544073|nr:ABC transporter permease [Eubacterium coprostanoligenes]MCI6253530.1 ABC transporter permease [Eubacterium coprostanoligenes]MDY5400105.1 ABC transporter permease [Eubacterium coprostanoligenes]